MWSDVEREIERADRRDRAGADGPPPSADDSPTERPSLTGARGGSARTTSSGGLQASDGSSSSSSESSAVWFPPHCGQCSTWRQRAQQASSLRIKSTTNDSDIGSISSPKYGAPRGRGGVGVQRKALQDRDGNASAPCRRSRCCGRTPARRVRVLCRAGPRSLIMPDPLPRSAANPPQVRCELMTIAFSPVHMAYCGPASCFRPTTNSRLVQSWRRTDTARSGCPPGRSPGPPSPVRRPATGSRRPPRRRARDLPARQARFPGGGSARPPTAPMTAISAPGQARHMSLPMPRESMTMYAPPNALRRIKQSRGTVAWAYAKASSAPWRIIPRHSRSLPGRNPGVSTRLTMGRLKESQSRTNRARLLRRRDVERARQDPGLVGHDAHRDPAQTGRTP